MQKPKGGQPWTITLIPEQRHLFGGQSMGSVRFEVSGLGLGIVE